jgi:excisionase family DNA binding protein
VLIFAGDVEEGRMGRMSQPPRPRRPLSPWPVGAAVLAVFIVLANFFHNSTLALELIVALAALIGLSLVRRPARDGQASQPTASSAGPLNVSQSSPLLQPGGSIARDLPAVLTVDEVAAYLRYDAQTIAAELDAGRLPGNKLRGEWRVRRVALDAWLDNIRPAEMPTAGR